MRHTTNNVVSPARRYTSRLFRFLAIAIPLCLALGWSLSVPTSTHAASCTPNQIWTLNAPAGSFTLWSDQPIFPGPAPSGQTATVTVTLDATTSPNTICGFSLNNAFTVTDPSTKNTIKISAVSPCSPAGTFDPSTGALTFNGTLTLNNVPLIQTPVVTNCATLSTENTITPPDHTTHSGKRVDGAGDVTLEGQTFFTNKIKVNIWLQFVGTFTRTS